MSSKLAPGSLCWSLTAGFPLWPAVVVHESQVPSSVLKEPHTSAQTLVRFFGSVSYGWMDVCYPFKENYETNSHPEGTWDGFEESIEEAKEFERSGKFADGSSLPQINLTFKQPHDDDSSSSSEDEAPKKRRVKRKRAKSSDDEEEDSDEEFRKKKKRKTGKSRDEGKQKTTTTVTRTRNIKANKAQKLFAKEIFGLVKQMEKFLKENNIDGALGILRKFDPKVTTKRANDKGEVVEAPGPYAKIDAQMLHISRLGRFVHGLAIEHRGNDIGPVADALLKHYRATVARELTIPTDVQVMIDKAKKSQEQKKSTSSLEDKTSEQANETTPTSTTTTTTSTKKKDILDHESDDDHSNIEEHESSSLPKIKQEQDDEQDEQDEQSENEEQKQVFHANIKTENNHNEDNEESIEDELLAPPKTEMEGVSSS